MPEPIRAYVARLYSDAEKDALSATLAVAFYIEVIDENDKPLTGEEFVVYQNDAEVQRGVLDPDGRAFLVGVERTKPFRFHVPGRVCAIGYGLKMLHTDKPESEYAGGFFDWEKADSAGPDQDGAAEAFWLDYLRTPYEPRPHSGPMTFWQHDHITRRDVAITRRVLERFPSEVAVIKAVPPRIRVGPLVRFTDSTRSVIWLELETPCLVRARTIKNKDQEYGPMKGTHSDKLKTEEFAAAYATSARVGGRHFAAVVVTGLTGDTLHDYTVDLAPLPAVGPIPVDPADIAGAKAFDGASAAAKEGVAAQLRECSFGPGSRFMAMRTLRKAYDDRLRFAFASCRKWPYDRGDEEVGPDMLEALGSTWLVRNTRLREWPNFLILTGDQVYCDDLGERTRRAVQAQRFSARIPGPADPGMIADGAWAGRYAHRTMSVPEQGAAKLREALIGPTRAKREQAKKQLEAHEKEMRSGPFPTERVQKERERVHGLLKTADQKAARDLDLLEIQLASLAAVPAGEQGRSRFRYLISNHLLWRIPVLAADVPEITDIWLKTADGAHFHAPAGSTRGVHAADFAEYAFMYESAWGHPGSATRKVLANIPSFMTFDDHEVTDDWNCESEWVKTISTPKDKKKHWPATITDALCAYWVYQGWCNIDPDEWEKDPRTKLIMEARGTGKDALAAMRKLIRPMAVPPAEPDPNGLVWHFKLPLEPTFLVTDCRTRRRLPEKPPDYDRDVAAYRYNQALDGLQLNWLSYQLMKNKHAAAFVVFQTPMILPHAAQWAMSTRIKWVEDNKDLRRKRDFEHMAAEKSWDDVMYVLRNQKFPGLKSLVILSGDVHHSYNAVGRFSDGRRYPEVVQLVSSGCRQALTSKSRAYLLAGHEVFSPTTSFRGLDIKLTGLSHADETKQNAMLLDNNVAIVEVVLDDTSLNKLGTGTYVAIVEEYLTQGAFPTSSRRDRPKATHFWYRVTWDDVTQVPRAWEVGIGDTSANWWGDIF